MMRTKMKPKAKMPMERRLRTMREKTRRMKREQKKKAKKSTN